MGVGTIVAHDVIHHAGGGATTDATMTGGAIAGAIIGSAILVGGPATIVGATTTGAIDGATTVGVIDATVAIDLCVVSIIGIAGAKPSQSRDINAGPTYEGVEQLSVS
ncbi:MAG TPA: hypothetical protein VJV03_02965 [Pyrinomonadaceae bacterium]|nr:hypothetical protein [Pyrinomonadaceae bacterium]